MKRLFTKMISMVCAVGLLMIPVTTAAHAQETPAVPVIGGSAQIEGQMTDEELAEALLKLGFSAEEAAQLIQMDHSRQFLALTRAAGFPSSPYVGQTCVIDYYVDIDNVASAGQMVYYLVDAGVPLVVAAGIGAAIFSSSLSNPSLHGVHIAVSYTYGPTNDGPFGWTPGYTNWNFY